MQIALVATGALVAQLAASGAPQPLALRDAIAEALAKSPVLGAAADQVAAAGIDERRTKAAFAPNVSPVLRINTGPSGATERALGAGITKQFAFGTALSLNVADRRSSSTPVTGGSGDLGYTFSLSQPLLRGFGAPTRAPLEQARRNVVGAERAETEARRDLVIAVAAAYLDALQADRVVTEADRALKRASDLRRSSTARVTVGLSTELDISRADWLASQSEAVLLDARDRQTDARDRLNRLLGRPIDGPVTLVDADLSQPTTLLDAFAPPSPGSDSDRLGALVAMAFAARADVREVRDRVRDAERAEHVARWNLLPQLNLEVGYANAGLTPSSIAAPPTSLMSGWRVGVSSDYSLNRAAASAVAASAAVGVRAATRTVQQAELQIAEDVRRADRDWSRSAAAIDLQTKAVAMAERQLRLAEIRYERGVAGNFDVTDAENNLYQAHTALVAAQAAHALAGLTLRRVVGALDPEAIK